MLMGKTPKNQVLSKPLLLLLVLFLGLIFHSLYFPCIFQGFGISSTLFVSFPIMILSTLFFLLKFTKKKPLSIQNKAPIEKNDVKVTTHEEIKIARVSENALEESEVLELEDFPSESEISSEEQSDDFELKWNMPIENVGKNLPIFDSYFSDYDDEDDEDNLIEISLPWIEDPKPNLPELIFSEKSFVEALEDMNEFNEEDNLIEIDISMGSIKCPRFELEISKLNNRL